MEEIKVATLTKEQVREFKDLRKMLDRIELLVAQANSARDAFWKKLTLEHLLPPGIHYIRGNSIHIQDTE